MDAFILAFSHKHAVSSAVIDYGWERIGRDTFRDLDGNTVRYLQTVDGLRGLRHGITVHLGYGWDRDDQRYGDFADAILKSRDAQVVNHLDNVKRRPA